MTKNEVNTTEIISDLKPFSRVSGDLLSPGIDLYSLYNDRQNG